MIAPATLLVTLLTTANGVPENGFPNWFERSVLVLTNRARANPTEALATCKAADCPDNAAKCYPTPVAPLVYDYKLNLSARFHSTNLVLSDAALSHPSPCQLVSNIAQLYPETCDGDPSCACQGGTSQCTCSDGMCSGTDPFTRIRSFEPAGCAENIEQGPTDPLGTLNLWLLEHCGSPFGTCGFTEPCLTAEGAQDGTNGHRYNILSGDNSLLGVGVYLAGAKACGPGDWSTQDFGCGTVAVPQLVAGTHLPQGTSTNVTFYANWYDTAAPRSAALNIGGTCETMTVDRGEGGNATYVWTGNIPTGTCTPYAFTFTDSRGNVVNLPAQGSYMAGELCTASMDYTPSSLTNSCGASGSGGNTGGSGTSGSTGGTQSDGGTVGDGGPGGFLGGNPSKGGGCSTGLAGGGGFPLLLLLGLLRRRR